MDAHFHEISNLSTYTNENKFIQNPWMLNIAKLMGGKPRGFDVEMQFVAHDMLRMQLYSTIIQMKNYLQPLFALYLLSFSTLTLMDTSALF